MQKRFFYLGILFVLLSAGGRLLAGPPLSPDERLPRDRFQEYTLYDESTRRSPEQAALQESEQAFALGELLLDIGAPEAAAREMGYALENFLFCGIDLTEAPVLQARLQELLQRADLYRQPLDLFGETDEAEYEFQAEEESPIEEMVDQTLQAVTIDPRIEHLIEQDILEQKFDFPVFVNSQVMTYLNYMTTGKKKGFVEIGLQRLERYRDMFQRIFREEGLPLDLIYFGLVESNFNTNAYSRARARGIWQFIQWTGRRYGLRVDWWVDERSDPEKSTRAACAYIKDLYGMFGDWYLVLAAYNSGEGRIQRILNRHPDKDYWEMTQGRYLPKETRGYVPAILAAIIIGKDPERFGISTTPSEALSYITVEIPSPTDLRVVAETIGVPVETLQDLNPALRRYLTPPDLKTYPLHLPVETDQETLALLYDLPVKERLMWVEHRIARGDTLYKISRKYGVPASAIKDFNDLKGSTPRLRVGEVLQIPLSNIYKGGGREAAADYRPEPRPAGKTYRVRRGDTLWSISRRTSIPVNQLMAWNGIQQTQLQAGTVLTLRDPAERTAPRSTSGAASRTAASGSGAAAPRGGSHTVAKGDTLWSISQKYNVELADLLDANGLSKGSKIQPGQSLRVPGGGSAASGPSAKADTGSGKTTAVNPSPGKEKNRVHVVRKGETLYAIARLYNTDVASLKRANSLHGDALKVGAQLVIPD